MRRASRSPSYLVRTPHSYCFRLNVPADLQKFVGKTELRYTLTTGYVGLARSKARLLAGQLQEFFRKLREIIKLGELTDQQIVDVVNRYFRNFLKGLEKVRVEPGAIGQGDLFRKVNMLNQKVCNRAKKALADCDYYYAWTFVNQALEREGLEIEKLSSTHNKMCREMLIGLIRFGAIEERRSQGDYSDDVAAAFPLSSDKKFQLETTVQKPSIPLEDVIEEYKRRQVQSKKWRPGTVRNHRPKIKAIVQGLGNRPVNQISVEDVRKLAKLLELLPPKFSLLKEYKDISKLSPKDLEGKHEKTLDVSTRRDYLNLARSIFAHAIECEYIEKNPVVSGFIPPKKKNTRGRKLPFDDPGDLEKIFNPDVYLKACKDRPSKFWVPILALYTGCRREEICQLYKEDVQKIDGIWCLNIKGLSSAAMDDDEDDDQMLKTDSAPRIIPLHPFIADELRFPEFVKRLKNRRDGRVFSELKKNNFKYGHKLGDWFNRYIRTKKVWWQIRQTIKQTHSGVLGWPLVSLIFYEPQSEFDVCYDPVKEEIQDPEIVEVTPLSNQMPVSRPPKVEALEDLAKLAFPVTKDEKREAVVYIEHIKRLEKVKTTAAKKKTAAARKKTSVAKKKTAVTGKKAVATAKKKAVAARKKTTVAKKKAVATKKKA